MTGEPCAPDGTPLSDVLADNARLAAEAARLRAVLQTVHHLATAPYWVPERRRQIAEMTRRDGRT